ncbi:MAG: 2-amino-4-hydroxy-6-hydroxymethyldihydropteridine diphosphokinase [Proteobacteria bacterium]|nr:2-amino-4-hydroxy-6-hydroxymethyldihydropteridine diphosphokinase [Pseudomonadota bacterium]
MPADAAGCYLIALGSNRRHHRYGAPERVLSAALEVLNGTEVRVIKASPVIRSAPLGPSRRRYANRAALVATRLDPPALLALLKRIERQFGRRRGGQRWTSRVLDLDIVLWGGGPWTSPGLTVPHPAFRQRAFVLVPALNIAPRWRDPLTGLTLRQLHARLTLPRPLPRARR